MQMDVAVPCKKGSKRPTHFHKTEAKSDASNTVPKTKHVCIVEAHEYTKQRLESSLPLNHVTGNGYNSMSCTGCALSCDRLGFYVT